MAIVMTISVPFVRTAIDTPKGMKGAFKVFDDACKDARAMAILQQTTVELQIRSDESLQIVPVGSASSSRLEGRNVADRETSNRGVPKAGPRKLPEGVDITMILANGQDLTDMGEARIQFFANGTCDELQLVLKEAETGKQRQVWLDVVTATLDFETDESKFKLQ